MRRDADPDELVLAGGGAQPLEADGGGVRVGAEHLEEDDRPQAELPAGGRGGARVAVVGGGGDPGAERVGGAGAGDREHLVELEQVLPPDVRLDPRPERLPVAEAGIDRVLEVRVRVDEAGHDRGVREVALAAPPGHLDDTPVLVAHDPALDRRPADGQHPVGADGCHVPNVAAVARRALRRSSSTLAQIEASYRMSSGIVSSVVVTGSTPGRATPTQQTTK